MRPANTYDPDVVDAQTRPEVARVAAFGAQQLGVPSETLRLHTHALRGGLESSSVARWVVQQRDGAGSRKLTFVVKRLDGAQQREAAIYAEVLAHIGNLAPVLLGVVPAGPDVTYLYLEYVRRARAWPWQEAAAAGRVLDALATLHARVPSGRLSGLDLSWDYESELAASAAATLDVFEQVVAGVELAWLGWARGALRRVCEALPQMRRSLLSAEPFRTAVIHGDVHSANVILASAQSAERVVLFDWARARVGSPLEDVASWLQSLGYWEPEAKRRHDTLLRRYLVARGQPEILTRGLRDAYWFAAASNVLAGALRYHLTVAAGGSGAPSRARADAGRAARDLLRVLRRADLVWRK
ncbi:MAG: aminoglycoside phosphotransferase family protein [Chloroflexota bacterium]|nr:aminoglycoside phosphotransferase family protein [Chloroflexota bacterium]